MKLVLLILTLPLNDKPYMSSAFVVVDTRIFKYPKIYQHGGICFVNAVIHVSLFTFIPITFPVFLSLEDIQISIF